MLVHITKSNILPSIYFSVLKVEQDKHIDTGRLLKSQSPLGWPKDRHPQGQR